MEFFQIDDIEARATGKSGCAHTNCTQNGCADGSCSKTACTDNSCTNSGCPTTS